VLEQGSAVLDAVGAVWLDHIRHLKYLRVWRLEESGTALKCERWMVKKLHLLEDRNILEMHE